MELLGWLASVYHSIFCLICFFFCVFCFELYCTGLDWTGLYCIGLYWIVWHFIALQLIVFYCILLYCIVTSSKRVVVQKSCHRCNILLLICSGILLSFNYLFDDNVCEFIFPTTYFFNRATTAFILCIL